MLRTNQQSEKSGRPVGAAKTNKELVEWHRLQWKNLNILAWQKGRDGISTTKWAIGKNAKAAFAKR